MLRSDAGTDTGSTTALLLVATVVAEDDGLGLAALGDACEANGAAYELRVVRNGRLLPAFSRENDFSAKLKTWYALVGDTVFFSAWLLTVIKTSVVVKTVFVNVMTLASLLLGTFPVC
jgi:hypothetical protein